MREPHTRRQLLQRAVHTSMRAAGLALFGSRAARPESVPVQATEVIR